VSIFFRCPSLPGLRRMAGDPPCAVQFISINDKGDRFELKEDVIRDVLNAVPEDMPISVVCVVGAFRTGKSFIMDLFLRYLRHTADPNTAEAKPASVAHEDWLLAEGTTLDALAHDEHSQESDDTRRLAEGFTWRPGSVRNTTGMWIWSKPFIRINPLHSAGNEAEPREVAVLLVDTQGMFDMKTAQMLTAAIFGLSTLISSYLVYNVEKRIQEDNLQHLALFTEYGRIALSTMEANTVGPVVARPPFQTLQFLVRDFQDYEDEEDVEACVASMAPYLTHVLENECIHKDLAEVRQHIGMCFERPAVFMLPHPGQEVTRRKYTGDLTVVSPAFCALVHRLAVSIFGTNNPSPGDKERAIEKGALPKKRVGDQYLTAQELLGYVRSYVRVFHEAAAGSGVFPEAKTLLAATAEANNYNATETNVRRYKTAMDQVCGAKQRYVATAKIDVTHKELLALCLQQFDRVATMGPRDKIVEFRERLERQLLDMYEEFVANNENKRPNVLQLITVLLICSAVAYLGASILSAFCWPPATLPFDYEYADVCNVMLKSLRDVYLTIFAFTLLTFVTKCWNQVAPVLQMVAGAAGNPSSAKAKGE